MDKDSTRGRIKNDKELKKCIHLQDREAAFEVIAKRKSGIHIVRLRDGGRVDHAIAVDTERNIIIDS